MRALSLALVLAACHPPEGPPCASEGDPTLEVTPSEVAFGEHRDGDPLRYGPPPQGGAPYAAIDLRVSGLEGMAEGVLIALSGVDLDSGEELGALQYPTRLVCANVGDSAGTWLANDVHHRFYGWELEELAGRPLLLEVSVSDMEDNAVEASLDATLIGME
jgi:hypothetical protein